MWTPFPTISHSSILDPLKRKASHLLLMWGWCSHRTFDSISSSPSFLLSLLAHQHPSHSHSSSLPRFVTLTQICVCSIGLYEIRRQKRQNRHFQAPRLPPQHHPQLWPIPTTHHQTIITIIMEAVIIMRGAAIIIIRVETIIPRKHWSHLRLKLLQSLSAQTINRTKHLIQHIQSMEFSGLMAIERDAKEETITTLLLIIISCHQHTQMVLLN